MTDFGRIIARLAARPSRVADGPPGLDFRPLREYKRVLNAHAEISDGVLDLRVSEQDLHGPEVPGGPVNHCRLRAPKGVRPIFSASQADGGDPLIDEAHILQRAQMAHVIDPA